MGGKKNKKKKQQRQEHKMKPKMRLIQKKTHKA